MNLPVCSALMLFCLAISSPSVFAYRVQAEHPRLFFRTQNWNNGHGLTLETIKARATRQDSKLVFDLLEGSIPNDALRALLLEDTDSSAFYARRAIDRIVQPIDMRVMTSDRGKDVAYYAMAFDWLYHHPVFSEKEKALAGENILAGARKLKEHLQSGAHIFHTRMYSWGAGLTLGALALVGHHPEADSLAEYGREYCAGVLFPARRLQGGAVHNSFGYGRKFTMWWTGHFISCWHSATGEDLWEVIEREQDGWAHNEILFNIYGRYPDGTYLRFGDSYSLTSDHYTFRAVSERTQAYGDPAGQALLNKLVRENAGRVVEKPSAYIYFLFYDPDALAGRIDELPTRKLFSRDGLGFVIWKSGWEESGTTVFFKCGNYFGDHGHFDQGHLDIYRGAPLLIDSGHYLTFRGEFRMEYWRKSVAHNTLLIVDPSVPGEEGGQRVFHSQSDDAIEVYLGNELAETGEIIDYLDEGPVAYVASDLTAAYPADRVREITREVAFVDDRYLVVLDRVWLVHEGFEPRVLWHCALYPHRDERANRFRVDRAGGRAIVTCLVPARPRMTWVDSFTVGGKKIEPADKLKAVDGMGVGRFEVSDPEGSLRQLFLHVIEVTDTPADPNAYEVAPGEVSANVNGALITVTAGGRQVKFRAGRPGLVP